MLDPAIYRTGQPNLVARPTFAAGVADPIRVRSGVVRKARDAVRLVPRRREGYVPGVGGGGLQEVEYDDEPARPGTDARPSSPASGSTRSPTVPRTTPSRPAATGCARGRRRSCTSA